MMASYSVYVLEFQSSETAEVGTSQSQIIITDHGLSPGDMVVNTYCRTRDAERGSRLVHSVGWDANTIPLEVNMVGCSVLDTVRLYKYIDRSTLIRPATFKLSRRGAGQSDLSFEIVTTASYLINLGQYVKVKYTNDSAVTTTQFMGIVTGVRNKAAYDGSTSIIQTIQCQGMKQVASRRTIMIDYAAGTTCGSIVTDMVDDYLFQEGVRKSTIDNGASLEEDWTSDVISINDVLDQCAKLSGFQWFIDDEGLMNFYQDASPADAVEDLDPASWTDFRNVEVSKEIDNYLNKFFLAGGTDENANPILFGSENFTESTAMQERCAGTGVYGMVERDSSIVESDYRNAEASSTTTTINITGHGQAVGDVVWNYTRNEYRQVLTTPTANQFTVDAFSSLSARTSDTAETGTDTTTIVMTSHGLSEGALIYNSTRDAYRFVERVIDDDKIIVASVTSQASGDTIYRGGDVIAFFDQANDAIQNMIKKQGNYPATISFETPNTDFEPITKLKVNLSNFGISNEYYLIEDIEVADLGKGLSHCWCRIKATKRDNSNFSTQRNLNGYDYWRDR